MSRYNNNKLRDVIATVIASIIIITVGISSIAIADYSYTYFLVLLDDIKGMGSDSIQRLAYVGILGYLVFKGFRKLMDWVLR